MELNSIFDFMVKKYAQAQGEVGMEVKEAGLGLAVTVLLLMLNKNISYDASFFTDIVTMAMKDIYNNEMDKTTKGIISYKTQLMTFFNRFLIQEPDGIIALLNNGGIHAEQFFLQWLGNMDFISSKNACKINTLALLSFMDKLPESIIKGKLEFIMKQTVPDVHTYIENLTKYGTNDNKRQLNIGKLLINKTRINESRPSVRKENVRKTQLYEEVDLKALFTNTFKNVLGKFGIGAEQLPGLVGEQKTLDKFYALFN